MAKYEFRVTKYDPNKRDERGIYQDQHEWTSISDIGKSVSRKNYLAIESAYWSWIHAALTSIDVRSLKVQHLEGPRYRAYYEKEPLLGQAWRRLSELGLSSGDLCEHEKLELLVRCALREMLWLRLVGPNNTFIHFGYDYYMYFGTDLTFSHELEVPRIFVEPMPSPYHPE